MISFFSCKLYLYLFALRASVFGLISFVRLDDLHMEEKFFINFANFGPFSETMKYKKANDISKILEVL